MHAPNSNLLQLHGVEHVYLCHVLGSMCSFIHVSHFMVGCLVLISYPCITYMFFTLVLFMAPALYFHLYVPWIQYIGYSPKLLFKTMCIVTSNLKTCMHKSWGNLS